MTRSSFTAKEVEGIIKTWKAGGGYVTCPSAWKGKRVKITLIE